MALPLAGVNVLNRNKKSLALDRRHPRGKAIFKQLAAKAGIIAGNFRPGVIRTKAAWCTTNSARRRQAPRGTALRDAADAPC
jgi:hypothetical protein